MPAFEKRPQPARVPCEGRDVDGETLDSQSVVFESVPLVNLGGLEQYCQRVRGTGSPKYAYRGKQIEYWLNAWNIAPCSIQSWLQERGASHSKSSGVSPAQVLEDTAKIFVEEEGRRHERKCKVVASGGRDRYQPL